LAIIITPHGPLSTQQVLLALFLLNYQTMGEIGKVRGGRFSGPAGVLLLTLDSEQSKWTEACWCTCMSSWVAKTFFILRNNELFLALDGRPASLLCGSLKQQKAALHKPFHARKRLWFFSKKVTRHISIHL